MVSEILERLETELDELSNVQLDTLLLEYEHVPMLTSLIESLAVDEDADKVEGDEEEDKDDLPLIDGDWSDDEDEE